jgi:hypothetical protein
MANYGLLYQCTFDPPSGSAFAFKPRYRLEILQKYYSGTAGNMIGGETPVIHSYQTDDPKAPVRGSSLSINLINKGSLPLSTFFSVNADEFKVRFYWTSLGLLLQTRDHLLFEGFLVQDDCSEIMVDFTHEINLSANDNLGLLKDIALDKAPGSYDYLNGSVTILETIAPHLLKIGTFTWAANGQVQMGDKIEIIGTAAAGIYSIVSFVLVGIYLEVTTLEAVPNVGSTSTTVNILRNNVLGYVSLLSVIKRCLSATDLELNTNIYCNIYESSQVDSSSFLGQTLIDVQTFLTNNTDYDNCYSVLEKILGRFNLSLFQAEGVWNIVRWDELRYFANLIHGFSYDKDMALIGNIVLGAALNAGIGEDTRALNGLQHRILRPFDYDKETFNYQQPKQLLRNFDLQQLGGLLRQYTVPVWITLDGVIHFTDPGGTRTLSFQKVSEYAVPWWYATTDPLGSGPTSVYFIRVTTDSVDNEIERYLVVQQNNIKSYKIEVNAGDTFKFSFSFKTNNTGSAPVLYLELYDGVIKKWYSEGGGPDIGWFDPAFPYMRNITHDWQTVNVDSTNHPIPFDGVMYIIFPGSTLVDMYFKDIRFDLSFTINQSAKIIGQTNTSTQFENTKNNKDAEIFLDSSPRNSIAGTLFLNQLNGVIQQRTETWRRERSVLILEQRKLGYITTFETLFWRRISRSILEGSFVGLLHTGNSRHVSLLSVFKYTYGSVANCNFVFGKFEIDYKHDMINNSPMWEIYNDVEVDADLTSAFEFKYLYAPI